MDSSNQHQSYNHESYNQPSQPGQFEPIQFQVQSSSPANPYQPTPSTSPKTCDQHAIAAPRLSQHFMHLAEGTQINPADDTLDILDLDTQKILTFIKDEKRQNGHPNSHTPHLAPSLIENWNQHYQVQNQDIHSFQNDLYHKLDSQTGPSSISEQKLFQLHPIPTQEYIGNGPTTQEPFGQSQTSSYRSFEYLPPGPTVIPNSQVPSAPTQAALPMAKSASSMSNKTKKPKTYNCTACNKWFTGLGHLKRHYSTTLHENAVAPHVMQDMAIKSFDSTGEFQFHSVDSSETAQPSDEIVHNKSEPSKTTTVKSKSKKTHCFDCNKTFKTPSYLKQHNNCLHSGEKPHKCTYCGKRFDCENKCEQHNKKHFGEKPHKCEICPKQFNYKNELRRHKYSHYGDKPYKCETCNKGFIRKDHMMNHCKTHKYLLKNAAAKED